MIAAIPREIPSRSRTPDPLSTRNHDHSNRTGSCCLGLGTQTRTQSGHSRVPASSLRRMCKPKMPERSQWNTWRFNESATKVLLRVLSCRCLSAESTEIRPDRENRQKTPARCKIQLPFREAEGIPGETPPPEAIMDTSQKGLEWWLNASRRPCKRSIPLIGYSHTPNICYQRYLSDFLM
jgi:hypothetical protein